LLTDSATYLQQKDSFQRPIHFCPAEGVYGSSRRVKSRLAVEQKEVASLQRLGLTEYESRIYLVLIKMGPIKASEISFFGQVPRTKTYGAIKELERKGLLHVLPGKPEVYLPASPEQALMPLVTKLSRDVKDSESVVQALSVTYETSKYVKRDIPKETEDFWQIDGRTNVFSKLSEIFGDASKSIYYSTTAAGLIRAYKAHSEILDRAKKRGVIVRVLTPISSENAGVAQQLSEIIEIKQLDKPLKANFASVDSTDLIVLDSKPDDLRTDQGADLAVWTKNMLFIELYEQLFNRVWNSLPNLEIPDRQKE